VSQPPLVALVIEDHPEHVRTICAHLERQSVDALVARSADEARTAMASDVFDFVILDLGLPERVGEQVRDDLGWTVLEALRDRWTREELFVLVLTTAPDQLKTLRDVLSNKGNAYAARHEEREFEGGLSRALEAGRKRRDGRVDDRLVVTSWSEARIIIDTNDELLAENATSRRRSIERPRGDVLRRVLGRLALADADPVDRSTGVSFDDLPDAGPAKTYAFRLSRWAERFFRGPEAARPFTSQGGRVIAHLRLSHAMDPAQRDLWKERRRGQWPVE
jgi:CheY-like chemotaxis protein